MTLQGLCGPREPTVERGHLLICEGKHFEVVVKRPSVEEKPQPPGLMLHQRGSQQLNLPLGICSSPSVNLNHQLNCRSLQMIMAFSDEIRSHQAKGLASCTLLLPMG